MRVIGVGDGIGCSRDQGFSGAAAIGIGNLHSDGRTNLSLRQLKGRARCAADVIAPGLSLVGEARITEAICIGNAVCVHGQDLALGRCAADSWQACWRVIGIGDRTGCSRG